VCRGWRGIVLLDRREIDGHAEGPGDFVGYAADRLQDVIDGVERQDPAVQKKHVFAGDRVHVGDVGLLFRRLEGALGGIVEGIPGIEDPGQAVQTDHEMRSRAEGVFPQRGAAGVALFARDLDPQPQDALLRHLDHGSLLVARVGHHDEVVPAEPVTPVLEDIIEAVPAPGLLVGGQEDPRCRLGHDPLVEEGLERKDRGHEVLLVVLGAASVDPAVTDPALVGVVLPESHFAGRHDVRVRHDPDRPVGPPARNPHGDVGPRAV